MMIKVKRAQADEVNFPSQVFAYVNSPHVVALIPKSKLVTSILLTENWTLDVTEDINVLASRFLEPDDE